jgi:hypothetical protein
MARNQRHRRLRWLTALSWSAFAAGLLIQLITPRLEVSNGAFVIPAALSTEEHNIRPDVMVAAERRKQLISAALTVLGAVALAYRYRYAFKTDRTDSTLTSTRRWDPGQ